MAKSLGGFGPQYAGMRGARPVGPARPVEEVATRPEAARVADDEDREWLAARYLTGDLDPVPAWATPLVGACVRRRRPPTSPASGGRGVEVWLVRTHEGDLWLATPGDLLDALGERRRRG